MRQQVFAGQQFDFRIDLVFADVVFDGGRIEPAGGFGRNGDVNALVLDQYLHARVIAVRQQQSDENRSGDDGQKRE